MQPIKTFLIEPMFDSEKTIYEPEDYTGNLWDNRALKGWRNPNTGLVTEWPHQQEVGAMWRATWYPKNFLWANETEAHLIVETPGGSWDIDARASNCTLPNDKTHRCWCRHGEPPNLHVDKSGITCNAGAGSIALGTYHGFLHNGYLT